MLCLYAFMGQCEYEDSIELQDNKGSFKVCLRAIVSCPKLEVPDRVRLPVCAVQHSSQANFMLKNVRYLSVYVCIPQLKRKSFFCVLSTSDSFVLCFPYLSFNSKRQAFFKWDGAAPFQLSPEQGLLKPGQQCRITVVFQPQEARVYQQQVFCRFGEGDKFDGSCTVLLLGQGTVAIGHEC